MTEVSTPGGEDGLGARMAQGVRRHVLGPEAQTDHGSVSGVFGDEVGDGVGAERCAPPGGEQRSGWICSPLGDLDVQHGDAG